jgi:hypothetical protein
MGRQPWAVTFSCDVLNIIITLSLECIRSCVCLVGASANTRTGYLNLGSRMKCKTKDNG